MSAKQKLKIASELLKETSELISDKTKNKIDDDLKKLEIFINEFEAIDDHELQTEKMAYSILSNITEVCFEKMNEYYGIKNNELKESSLLNSLLSNKDKKQTCKIISKILENDINRFVIKDMNINEFVKIMNLDMEESSEEGK